MRHRDAQENASFDRPLTRREFLRAGGLSLLGAGLLSENARGAQTALPAGRAVSCIVLNLTGGPSHLDTWDMKPDAPIGIRSPFQPIPTNVPGIEICEIFPRMARHADLFAIVRSMRHPDAGGDTRHSDTLFDNLFTEAEENTPVRCAPNSARNARKPAPAWVSLPGSAPDWTQSTAAYDLSRETNATRARYGHNRFGQSCLLARRLVERGIRFVRVDMFDLGCDRVTWDAHGSAPFPALDAYKNVCGPWFDNGYASLIEDLKARGLYDSTVVLASGEFGRTPKVNVTGGRDHWPHCWSLIVGGGGIRGGQVVGASDAIGGYPIARPVTPAEITSTLRFALGMNPMHGIFTPDREAFHSVEPVALPVHELF